MLAGEVSLREHCPPTSQQFFEDALSGLTDPHRPNSNLPTQRGDLQ